MELRIQIEDELVRDLLISAFEGGSNYWIEYIDIAPGYKFYDAAVSSDGGFLKIYPGDDKKAYILNAWKCAMGMALLCKNHPRHFADLISENFDATTGDVFLQLCLFGEIIYA